jgi:hypothetical protein
MRIDKAHELIASKVRNTSAEFFKTICWSSRTKISEFMKTRFELVKTKKIIQKCACGSSGI